jgi:tetratricopeptide (TPR) repeat protein
MKIENFLFAAGITFMPENDSEILRLRQKMQEEQQRLEQERQEELQRLEQEKLKAREENYQKLVQSAENALVQQQYQAAKDFYRQAAKIKSESRDYINSKITEIDIIALCKEADQLFVSKQYEKAKEKYAAALAIKPNYKTDFINIKIKEIDDFQVFLEERTYTQYDYKDIEPNDYIAKNEYIENEFHKNLYATGETLPTTTISIVYEVDTLGITVSNYTSSGRNGNLNTLLDRLTKDIKLKSCYVKSYAINARAEFNYTLEYYSHGMVTVTKNTKGTIAKNDNFDAYRARIDRDLLSAPFGKYVFDVNTTTINGRKYHDNKLLAINRTGGPSNVLLSLLVPGLGDHRVTYGKKNGLGVMFTTYGLIGAGVGLKFYSNREYAKYHAATEQEAMDDHYKKANTTNQVFYGCVVAGSIIWISDIIWVWSKGAKNAKTYRRSHWSFYYEPDLQATGLSYTVNF